MTLLNRYLKFPSFGVMRRNFDHSALCAEISIIRRYAPKFVVIAGAAAARVTAAPLEAQWPRDLPGPAWEHNRSAKTFEE
jgi:hypothetical protein